MSNYKSGKVEYQNLMVNQIIEKLYIFPEI